MDRRPEVVQHMVAAECMVPLWNRKHSETLCWLGNDPAHTEVVAVDKADNVA